MLNGVAMKCEAFRFVLSLFAPSDKEGGRKPPRFVVKEKT
jgi:hypothetical protein